MLRVMKGGFGVSGRLGEGVVLARLSDGGWNGPSAIATGGGGSGFQVGGQVTEFVIILNSRAAVNAFAHGGNVQFGGALSVASRPEGRTAEAGVLPVAAIYTYSRSKGLFAGASLEGTLLVPQSDKNAVYSGRRVTSVQILRGRVAPPQSAQPLIAALRRYWRTGAPHSISDFGLRIADYGIRMGRRAPPLVGICKRSAIFEIRNG